MEYKTREWRKPTTNRHSALFLPQEVHAVAMPCLGKKVLKTTTLGLTNELRTATTLWFNKIEYLLEVRYLAKESTQSHNCLAKKSAKIQNCVLPEKARQNKEQCVLRQGTHSRKPLSSQRAYLPPRLRALPTEVLRTAKPCRNASKYLQQQLRVLPEKYVQPQCFVLSNKVRTATTPCLVK